MNHEDYQASSIRALIQHKNTDHKNETFDLQVSKKLPINHTLKHKGMEFPCFKCSFKSIAQQSCNLDTIIKLSTKKIKSQAKKQ